MNGNGTLLFPAAAAACAFASNWAQKLLKRATEKFNKKKRKTTAILN